MTLEEFVKNHTGEIDDDHFLKSKIFRILKLKKSFKEEIKESIDWSS